MRPIEKHPGMIGIAMGSAEKGELLEVGIDFGVMRFVVPSAVNPDAIEGEYSVVPDDQKALTHEKRPEDD